MLDTLPVEGILEILSYLPVQSLRVLQLVSRDWQAFVKTNQTTVFKNAALLHGFLTSSDVTSMAELQSLYTVRSFTGVHDWKSFCHRRQSIDLSWCGRGPSSIKKYTATGDSVHRIKIDEDAGYIITTSQRGGLDVTDLSRNELLWSLPQEYVRPYAHCEYGAGFIIFDRWEGSKEVWRRACNYDPANIPNEFPPDMDQYIHSEFASRRGSTSGHGHFKPWALLRMPSITHAYRFVYPTLLVAGRNEAYLWDIPSATLLQTISGIQMDGSRRAVCYVELSCRHVFICVEEILRIFSRETGRVVLDITANRESPAPWKFFMNAITGNANGVLQPYDITGQEVIDHSSRRQFDEFIAVHVSACGSHIVALLLSSRLMILYNFERVIKGEIELRDAMVEIQLGPAFYSSRYLAFENDRIAVATGFGLFVLSIQPVPGPLETTTGSQSVVPSLVLPNGISVRICLARCFGSHPLLRCISCLQMTDTELFLNWDPIDMLATDTMEYFHVLINNAVASDDDLTDTDVIEVEFVPGLSTVMCIDMLSL